MSSTERIRTHTALHVVKGAARRILGTKWTAGVYVEGLHGRLTLKCDRQPTETEIRKVESLANEKVDADLEVQELEIDRTEAESRWGDDIYDLFPIPAGVTRLRILHIPDWNVNACKEPHAKRTGEIRGIRLGKARYRAGKQLLEIPFDLKSSDEASRLRESS